VKSGESSYRPLPDDLWWLLKDAVGKGVFPGAAAAIAHGPPESRGQWMGCCGREALVPVEKALDIGTCFDLASLTKPLATTLAILALVEEGRIALADHLPALLEKKVPADKCSISLQQLLCHGSGLPAYHPYFEELATMGVAARREAMLERILTEPLAAPSGTRAVYSDLGFMLLGRIVEQQSGTSLDGFVRERIYQPLGLDDSLFFRPLAEPPPGGKSFAATEDCPWRGRVLGGEVSDENTHVLGGVAGQAGLFGDVKSVVALAAFLLDCWKDRAVHPAWSNGLLSTFLAREGSIPASTWALGFDTPSPTGSSAGSFFHPTSVGHLGFTGTSFWIDPTRDLAVVLLTNRVHPSRANELIKQFRPLFHNAVFASLGLC